MDDAFGYALVVALGLVGGCVGGVVGTGSSIVLLPALVFVFGPKEAVPIMAVASVIGNASRVVAWRREIDWTAVAWYAIPGAPAAALGARTLLALPPRLIDVALGTFFLVMIAWRHRRRDATAAPLARARLAIAGAAIGFVTGVVLSTGPLSVPVFAAYGLSGGAFLGTEAASAVALYVAKVATFRQFGAMPLDVFAKGLFVGGALMGGTFVGRAIVRRIGADLFHRLLDVVMATAGLAMIWQGLH